MPLYTGDGTEIESIRTGDGTGIAEVRTGDGTVLFKSVIGGEQFFTASRRSTAVYGYDLSTAYDITTSAFDDTLDVTNEISDLNGIAFDDTGDLLFALGSNSNAVYEYSLSTTFDLTTASYTGNSEGISASFPNGLEWSSDGTRFYIADGGGSIESYTVSSPFAISTASVANSLTTTGEDGTPVGAVWNQDGTSLYVVGNSNGSIYRYSLTTGFDLSTATYSGDSFDVSTQNGSPGGMSWSASGDSFVLSGSDDVIYKYILTTPFDITTASYTGDSFDVSANSTDTRTVEWDVQPQYQ